MKQETRNKKNLSENSHSRGFVMLMLHFLSENGLTPRLRRVDTISVHGNSTLRRVHSSGFVMLYAILLTSVILTIGFGMLDVMLKQIKLSGTTRESQFAFFAADAGTECALYWDVVRQAFTDPLILNIQCAGATITILPKITPATPQTTFSFNMANNRCATVTVVKDFTTSSTTIRSQGYNVGPCPIVGVNPRRVERGLQVDY